MSDETTFTSEYLRRGKQREAGERDSEGGYQLPQEIEARIAVDLARISPFRRLAQTVRTGSAGYRKLVATGGTSSGWLNEPGDLPTITEISPPSGELYANPAASQAMLDDASFDVESWLASEIALEFARAETPAFISGNGSSRPLGFLCAPASKEGDATRPFGTLQFVEAEEDAPGNTLVDLVHALKAGQRQGATWVMNSATMAQVRKLKTADGAFLWQPGLVEGQPDRLLGYPIAEADDMPDIAPGSFPIAFGNFRTGYLIAERSATKILRDPFTNKPFIHFYATKRVGGQVLDSNAIKLLRIAA